MCLTYDVTIKNGDDGDPVQSSGPSCGRPWKLQVCLLILGVASHHACWALSRWKSLGPGWVKKRRTTPMFRNQRRHHCWIRMISMISQFSGDMPLYVSNYPYYFLHIPHYSNPKNVSENSQFNKFTI